MGVWMGDWVNGWMGECADIWMDGCVGWRMMDG